MEYTLERLLKDKKLRATVAKERFAFEDGNGVVQCLDFENLTYLKNHRALYDFLCQAGGEELLGKLLAQGKTCLTDDPDSANTGVRGIRGTEKYFLKTNAGDSTVLASILWGIQGLSETMEGFDPDKVRIVTADTAETDDEEPEEENTEALLDLDDMSDEEPQEELLPAHTDVSLVQKDGKFSLYDNETKEFITLNCPDAPDGQIDSMAVCEKLEIPERREGQFNGMEEAEINLGWRYKLSEDTDLWGWISADCTRVSAPIFQKIEVRCDGAFYDLETMNILAWSGRGLYQAGVGQKLRCVFTNVFEPKEGQEISYTQSYAWHLLMRTDEDGETGLLSYVEEYEEACVSQPTYEVWFSKGVLRLRKRDRREQTICLCDSMSLDCCVSCFTGESIRFSHNPVFKSAEYIDAVQLHGTALEFSSFEEAEKYYAVRGRDGYWGVIHMWRYPFAEDVVERCTPSAFTSVRVLDEDAGLALVERFGRWGVYDCLNDCYPVPCEYDRVTLCRNVFTGNPNGFEVHRMDFVGRIRMNGEWETPLRRTEE